ncbi:MAG TPA: stage 0 sporulation protein J [Candidatus Taylorbacteria bacterium]|nr:MAG: ParB-like protein partition protein [Parcubacteria group bacterium GW2011_GWF2_50_9]HCB35605.1 stage 0 sporulation protein J [Candidatus Taylorbacteria bacterium]
MFLTANSYFMSNFVSNAVFWVEVEKIKPNPFQPRREFDEARLSELAESIRMYGILQPLVVTRKEIQREDGSFYTEYELISGERRLRASKIAGVSQVPVLIRQGEENEREKLELAIIENLQREDLNAVDRARAFHRLVAEFGFKHADIGKKVGKSREYVTNTLRILDLSEEILTALSEGKINEGHTRPLLMLTTRPQEQQVLFKEILYKKITVREAENNARRIAYDRARKKDFPVDPELLAIEEKLREQLGTRVRIERTEAGGKVLIDFFSNEDLRSLLALMEANRMKSPTEMLDRHIERINQAQGSSPTRSADSLSGAPEFLDDRTPIEKAAEEDEDIYSVKNFSI